MELTIMQLVFGAIILAAICLGAGAFIGMVITAIMSVAKEGDRQWQEYIENRETPSGRL